MHNLRGHALLPSLLALIETRSVSLAAARMGVSQPAMSRTLARLRRHFGDAVLARLGSGMEPTPLALELLPRLREWAMDTDLLLHPEPFDPRTATRVFRAIIPDVIAAWLAPRLFAMLRNEAPSCELELIPWSDQRTRRDIDFVVTSEIAGFASWRRCALFTDTDALAYAVADGPPDDELRAAHVAVVPAGADRDPVDEWLESHGMARTVALTVPHYLLALHLVAKGGLVALLPQRLLDSAAWPGMIGHCASQAITEPDQGFLLHSPRVDHDSAGHWIRAAVSRIAATCPT